MHVPHRTEILGSILENSAYYSQVVDNNIVIPWKNSKLLYNSSVYVKVNDSVC